MVFFEVLGFEIFKEEWVVFDEEEFEIGDYYIVIDLVGFIDILFMFKKNKWLDSIFIVVVKVNE